jgi:uncharacterized membrane protein YfcA
MDVVGAIGLGVGAGMVAGLLGVGGGVIFVPALVIFLGLGQLEAEATSLLAMVPVALVGAWRQHGYGNVRLREAGLLGALALAGGLGGVALANALPERALELAFAALMVFTAAQMARRALRPASD